jgi:hypothetical protein
MSHDVDWRIQGPPMDHIIARKDRFDSKIIQSIHLKNPYYNIPDYIYLEEKYNIRSTFFFRTIYENGNYMDYENDIKTLCNGGWEVGLHCDPLSVNNYAEIEKEKNQLEKITKSSIKSNRSHYLNFSNNLPIILKKLGFLYDSSFKKSKDKIEKEDMGYNILDGIIEFPVTLMDAYIFSYMNIQEDKIVDLFGKTIDFAKRQNDKFNIVTVIWHENVLKMKGGRVYEKILEFLSGQEKIMVKRGIDLANIIFEKNPNLK